MSKKLGENKTNRNGAAMIFGVSIVTIDNWLQQGCPYKQKGNRGKPWVLDTVDIFNWKLKQELKKYNVSESHKELDIKIKQEKLRLTSAQADSEEIKVNLALKKSVDVEKLELALASLFNLMRNKLLSVPERVEATLIGETDKYIFRDTLSDEIKSSIYEICDGVGETIKKAIC